MKGKAVNLRVEIRRIQATTFSGRNLGSVQLAADEGTLVVTKKRLRGSKFDPFFFSIEKVIGYSEGEGGKESTAYATVITNHVLRTIEGKGIVEGSIVKLVDDDGVAHTIRLDGDADIVVSEMSDAEDDTKIEPVESADDEEEASLRPSKVRTRTREAPAHKPKPSAPSAGVRTKRNRDLDF